MEAKRVKLARTETNANEDTLGEDLHPSAWMPLNRHHNAPAGRIFAPGECDEIGAKLADFLGSENAGENDEEVTRDEEGAEKEKARSHIKFHRLSCRDPEIGRKSAFLDHQSSWKAHESSNWTCGWRSLLFLPLLPRLPASSVSQNLPKHRSTSANSKRV